MVGVPHRPLLPSLPTLYVVALRVVALWLSLVVTFACSREEQADRVLVAKKKREEAHGCLQYTDVSIDVCGKIEDYPTKGSF